jgi:hypothetical protein
MTLFVAEFSSFLLLGVFSSKQEPLEPHLVQLREIASPLLQVASAEMCSEEDPFRTPSC